MLARNLISPFASRTRQPTHPSQVAAENPLARSCVFLYTAADWPGPDPIARVTPAVNASVSTALGASGRGIVYSGSSGVNTFFGSYSAAMKNLHAAPATWVFRLRLTSTASHTGLMQMSDSPLASGDRGWNVSGAAPSGGFGLMLGRGSSIGQLTTPNANIPTGRDFDLVVAHSGAIAPTGQIYVDGAAVATTSVNGSGTTGPMTTQALFLASDQYGGDLGGTLYLAAVFARQWTAQDAAEFHRDPWQLASKSQVMTRFWGPPSLSGSALFYGAGALT